VKSPEIAWRNNKNAPKMCSPVLTNNLLFYIDDGGIVSCIDPKTGEAHYRERIGGKYSASPIVVENKIYFASREGIVTVIAAQKEFKILAQNPVEGSLMASPVAIDQQLYLRTEKALYRISQ
jgi:outer membrane protein assembly factor BamB